MESEVIWNSPIIDIREKSWNVYIQLRYCGRDYFRNGAAILKMLYVLVQI